MSRMISHAGDAGLRIADLTALALALPIAHRLFGLRWPPLPPLEHYWLALVVTLVLWTASAWVHSVYEERPRAGLSSIGRLGRALAAVALLEVVATLPFRSEPMPLLPALYFVLALLLLSANRAAFRVLAVAARRRGYAARRYAVVGTGGLAREIVESIGRHPEWGFAFAGFVVPDGSRTRSRGPILGRLSHLGRILEDEVLDEVIFALQRHERRAAERAVQLCQEQGVEVQICLDMLSYGPSRMGVTYFDGTPYLTFTRTPTDALALAAKRAFDVVASVAVLVLLAPVFAAIAAAISLEDGGPVFFRQKRVGLNGRVFTMLKFRSMFCGAEERLESLKALNEMSGPVFKIARDPRVTRIGRFIRRTSLDELPQFWNVLKGEMSVVGPRPPIPSEVRQYRRWQRRRLSMKPGITCIWQISGRNNVNFERWMELDLQYIDGWSLWRDVEICLKTFPAVLSARGAR